MWCQEFSLKLEWGNTLNCALKAGSAPSIFFKMGWYSSMSYPHEFLCQLNSPDSVSSWRGKGQTGLKFWVGLEFHDLPDSAALDKVRPDSEALMERPQRCLVKRWPKEKKICSWRRELHFRSCFLAFYTALLFWPLISFVGTRNSNDHYFNFISKGRESAQV